MPLQIIRDDITRVTADAIVNSTNRHLISGGHGVDASIHEAAGPELAAALAEIGYCERGSAVITESFGIHSCRYIIHTAGPRFIDGFHGEREMLEKCYRSVLELAVRNGCQSLAIPVLSAGAYGYPRREAYSIATSSIRSFFMETEEDMMVYLVIFDREMKKEAVSASDSVEEHIDSGYVYERKAELYKLRRRRFPRLEKEDVCGSLADISFSEENYCANTGVPEADYAAESVSACAMEPEPVPAPAPVLDDYVMQDLPFGEMCEWWIEKKKMTKTEFYNAANISKATFWNLKKKFMTQNLKKTTAFACVIGLKLSLPEAEDILKRAGLAFSPFLPVDIIVERRIREKSYDIDDINLELFDADLTPLGSM